LNNTSKQHETSLILVKGEGERGRERERGQSCREEVKVRNINCEFPRHA